MPKEGANSEIRYLGKGAKPEVCMWAGANLKSDRVDHESDGIIMFEKVLCKL